MYSGGMFGKVSLGQCGPWCYETYCTKAVGFTWWNLPVINSLARVHRVYEAMNVYCMFEESFLCPRWSPFSSVLGNCVPYASQNDPADDQMPVQKNISVSDYTPLKTGLGFTFSWEYVYSYKDMNLTLEQIENVIFTWNISVVLFH